MRRRKTIYGTSRQRRVFNVWLVVRAEKRQDVNFWTLDIEYLYFIVLGLWYKQAVKNLPAKLSEAAAISLHSKIFVHWEDGSNYNKVNEDTIGMNPSV